MSRKRQKRTENTTNATQRTQEQKRELQKNILRLLSLIAITIAVCLVYRIFTAHGSIAILVIYMCITAAVVFAYVIYNRGFSRKGITAEMLPDTMTDEQKQEFIADAERRLKKSRPLLMLVFAFSFTLVLDVLELFALPMFQKLLGL